MSNVPDKVLLEFRFARGHRIPWKPTHFEKPRTQYRYTGSPYSNNSSDKGNLPMEHYRFFCGMEWGDAKRAHCRACRTWVSWPWDVKNPSEQLRKHLEEKECNVKLMEAYKLLLRDKKCVMCGKHCRKGKWGVPLCSQDCIKEWALKKTQPDALIAALAKVTQRDSNGREGGGSEKNQSHQAANGPGGRVPGEDDFTNTSGTVSGDESYQGRLNYPYGWCD